ncbi:MAG: DsbA family protein [Pseudonocardia sp.]
MGGASRSEDRRRQEAAAARMRAAGISPPPTARKKKTSPMVYVGAVLGLAVVIGVGAFLLNRSSGPAAVANYPVAASKGVVTLGDTSAPVKIDIYEDYLCPGCKVFSDRDHDDLTNALNEGKITVRFHPLALLNEETTPPGYATRAANAALCAAEGGIFPAYHDKLFAEQPAAGGPGLTDAQLIAFGTELGAPAGFDECVTSGPHADAIGAETKKAVADPNLQTNNRFGTPTAAVDGQKVSISSSGWIDDAIAAG